jgi:hypothetical protein
MAKYKADEVVRGLDTPFPTNNFTVRITKMEKGRSSAGNPMITTDIEIVDPQYVEAGSAKIQTAGMTAKLYGMLDPSNPYGLSKMIGALKRAGLDPVVEQGLDEGELFDDDPAALKPFVGKKFQMTLGCKPRVQMRYPTPEEKAAGTKPTPLKTATGQDIVSGFQMEADWSNVTGPDIGEGEAFN